MIIRFICLLACIYYFTVNAAPQTENNVVSTQSDSTAPIKFKITIIHSDSSKISPDPTHPQRLLGNVKLRHKDMLMTCDSLYQYSDSNYIEAFGRVHAVQNDTLNLWGDYLFYNGNTEKAKVRHNVVMSNPQLTLTTDSLDYDMANRIGHYFNGGTIRDSINTLTSDIGYYYVAYDQTFFKDSVRVYTPQYTLYSDTLKYHTQTKIVSILGPTDLIGENRTLYSEDGWYNSLTSHAELYKNNILTYDNYIGNSDTLIVDSITGTALMHRNIHLFDTINNTVVTGNYGEVLKNNDYAFVTQKAILTLIGQSDSLHIHGDTLSISKDSVGNNVLKAYYHTKFYSMDLQGMCDSMVYPVADSTVYLHREPIVWANGNQLTATDISMHVVDNQVDKFDLRNKAMIINLVDTTMYKLLPDQIGVLFNQIKGRDMTGYVRNNELYLMMVNGSGESIFYPDDQGYIIGLNRASSSTIKIELKNKKVTDITFITKPEGTLNPLFLVKPEERKLKDFQWHIHKKPLKKEDIFQYDNILPQDSITPQTNKL